MAKKTTKKQNEELRLNMQVEVSMDELSAADVDALMLGETIESMIEEEIVEPSAAVESVIEAVAAPEVEVAAEPKPKKTKKEVTPKTPRVGYVGHSVSQVLADRLSGDVTSNVILEAADVALDTTELEAKQKALMAMLDISPTRARSSNLDGVATTQKKVAQKAVQLFSWMKNSGKLNEVMARAFTVLARDGELTSGEKGNLHAELLAKPYSLGTCRAQSGQIFALFPMLKIVTKTDKGHYALNPESLIFAKAKAELAL